MIQRLELELRSIWKSHLLKESDESQGDRPRISKPPNLVPARHQTKWRRVLESSYVVCQSSRYQSCACHISPMLKTSRNDCHYKRYPAPSAYFPGWPTPGLRRRLFQIGLDYITVIQIRMRRSSKIGPQRARLGRRDPIGSTISPKHLQTSGISPRI